MKPDNVYLADAEKPEIRLGLTNWLIINIIICFVNNIFVFVHIKVTSEYPKFWILK